MTTLPTPQPRHLLSSWGLSFCIHAVALSGAVIFLHDLPRVEPPMYRLEFLLTEPKSVSDAAMSQEATTVTERSSPSTPTHARTANHSSSQMIEQQARAETSVVQSNVNTITTAAVEPRITRQLSTTIDPTPVLSSTPIERQTETLPPVTESRRPTPMNTVQPLERPFATASPQVAASPTAEPMNTQLQDDVTHPSPSASQSSQSVGETTSNPSADSATAQLTTQFSVTGSQTDTQVTGTSSPPSHMESGSPSTGPQQTLVMNHPPITRTIPSKPDYEWLTDLLKRRIMGLQAYPRLARMQGWEGIVVVRATIKNDGSLLDAVVTESSGYASLDEEALKLMQRACPIRLQHDLGQSHIEVFVPVHYRLER
jgi:TonB family protein